MVRPRLMGGGGFTRAEMVPTWIGHNAFRLLLLTRVESQNECTLATAALPRSGGAGGVAGGRVRDSLTVAGVRVDGAVKGTVDGERFVVGTQAVSVGVVVREEATLQKKGRKKSRELKLQEKKKGKENISNG